MVQLTGSVRSNESGNTYHKMSIKRSTTFIFVISFYNQDLNPDIDENTGQRTQPVVIVMAENHHRILIPVITSMQNEISKEGRLPW